MLICLQSAEHDDEVAVIQASSYRLRSHHMLSGSRYQSMYQSITYMPSPQAQTGLGGAI